jgi:RNA polymerase sigma-70 factor (ECF subfamily)
LNADAGERVAKAGASGPPDVQDLVDHLFRRESARMTASLARQLGPAQLPLIEDVVQEALLRALRLWPFAGVPENPAGWLHLTARRLALDRLRREARLERAEPGVEEDLLAPAPAEPGALGDDQLALVFLGCHPELSREQQLALTLKIACGFGVAEIARAFLAQTVTIAQRLVRAQRRIREAHLPLALPPEPELPARLDAVLTVLYLLFNEGYAAHAGEDLVRRELCDEALRLVEALAASSTGDRPETHALAALLQLQASRLAARTDAAGRLVLLADQERALWDRAAIARGFAHLERAARGPRLTSWHVEAAIAAQHAGAADAAGTDWAAVVTLYDQLLALDGSPVVALNRAVALAELRGADAGLAATEPLRREPGLQRFHLLHAVRGELLRRAGRAAEARQALQEALACPCSEPERRLMRERLEGLERRAEDAPGRSA